MHDFYKRKNLIKISLDMYSTFPEQVMIPSEAYDHLVRGDIEYVTLDKLMGRIPAVMLAPYPPGIAVIMPGERLLRNAQQYSIISPWQKNTTIGILASKPKYTV